MKKVLLSAFALSSLAASASINSHTVNRINTVNEVKATYPIKSNRKEITVNPIGGLDMPKLAILTGNTIKWQPKYGHPKRLTNKLRCSHNSKIKRRKRN